MLKNTVVFTIKDKSVTQERIEEYKKKHAATRIDRQIIWYIATSSKDHASIAKKVKEEISMMDRRVQEIIDLRKKAYQRSRSSYGVMPAGPGEYNCRDIHNKINDALPIPMTQFIIIHTPYKVPDSIRNISDHILEADSRNNERKRLISTMSESEVRGLSSGDELNVGRVRFPSHYILGAHEAEELIAIGLNRLWYFCRNSMDLEYIYLRDILTRKNTIEITPDVAAYLRLSLELLYSDPQGLSKYGPFLFVHAGKRIELADYLEECLDNNMWPIAISEYADLNVKLVDLKGAFPYRPFKEECDDERRAIPIKNSGKISPLFKMLHLHYKTISYIRRGHYRNFLMRQDSFGDDTGKPFSYGGSGIDALDFYILTSTDDNSIPEVLASIIHLMDENTIKYFKSSGKEGSISSSEEFESRLRKMRLGEAGRDDRDPKIVTALYRRVIDDLSRLLEDRLERKRKEEALDSALTGIMNSSIRPQSSPARQKLLTKIKKVAKSELRRFPNRYKNLSDAQNQIVRRAEMGGYRDWHHAQRDLGKEGG